MTKDSLVHVLSACDDNYAQHLSVVITSLLENASEPENIYYHIINVDISDNNKSKLNSIANQYNTRIDFIDTNKREFLGFPTSNQFPVAIYYRLIAHRLLDKDIKRLIYLDSDIVVKSDISELWEVNMGDFPIAAVLDNLGYYRFKDLNLPEDTAYFNSGVLLLNLEMWRENSIGEKVINYIEKNKNNLMWADQDALNVVLYKKWLSLHPKWNVQYNMYSLRRFEQNFTNKVIDEVLENPSIIHYTSSKPWFYKDIHPLKDQYYFYLSLTPWRNFTPTDKSLNDILNKIVRKIKWRIKKSLPENIYLYARSLKNRTN